MKSLTELESFIAQFRARQHERGFERIDFQDEMLAQIALALTLLAEKQ